MTETPPLLTESGTILWLKFSITAALLGWLYVRYKSGDPKGARPRPLSLRARGVLVLAVLFSFAVFHNFGKPRSGSFVHYGEMFHYYLGPKYFDELGYFELYKAVIVADSEQDQALAGLPFYTDLTTYQNASRDVLLANAAPVRALFSEKRWQAFKQDVAFFKQATATPRYPGLFFQVMDHGYNASPVSTFVLGLLTHLIPVTQLWLLAAIDVLLVACMIALVFLVFGFEMGALFGVYFFVNILNDHGYISGGALRYDWLFCVVAAVCLLERGRHAASSAFLTAAAMLKVFPAVLLYGAGVSIARKVKEARALPRSSARFLVAAGATALALFLLPAASMGSVLEPWQEFSKKTALHNDGVYVNHLGLRGLVLFEPSHLSLSKFIETYSSGATNDIVRNWQDAKEAEFQDAKPVIAFCSLLVLVCLAVVVWRRRESDIEGVLWPLMLIYTVSYPSHYYYAFLCLFVLLFFRREDPLRALVPLSLLWVFNLVALVTDYCAPSPIVFYTLINFYLFVCLASILGFELFGHALGTRTEVAVARSPENGAVGKRGRKKRR